MAAAFPTKYRTTIPLGTIISQLAQITLNAHTGTFQNWAPKIGTQFQVCDGEILAHRATAIPVFTDQNCQIDRQNSRDPGI